MIDCTITIQCDGNGDDDYCPAEFHMKNHGGSWVDPINVAHQLHLRGWFTVPGDRAGAPHLLCPRHATGTETNDAR